MNAAHTALDNTFWELVHNCTSQNGGEASLRACNALEEYVGDLIYTSVQKALRSAMSGAIKPTGDCSVCVLGIDGACYCSVVATLPT